MKLRSSPSLIQVPRCARATRGLRLRCGSAPARWRPISPPFRLMLCRRPRTATRAARRCCRPVAAAGTALVRLEGRGSAASAC
uniref:Uncharacterized protein n=1 Tax=Setaria viridis TaxID=4556 RepID=A0A4U6WIT4_SETVI|nr:hypothetical protein SEVIR_1G083950v2 [Setaria viridis]